MNKIEAKENTNKTAFHVGTMESFHVGIMDEGLTV